MIAVAVIGLEPPRGGLQFAANRTTFSLFPVPALNDAVCLAVSNHPGDNNALGEPRMREGQRSAVRLNCGVSFLRY